MTERTLNAEVVIMTSFQDADPMGVIYHGNYFRYFEEARRVMMEKIDYGYLAMSASGYMWPIIDTAVRYVKPIQFNQEIRVTATLTEYENRLRTDYVIYDAESGKRLTKGHTTQVAVSIDEQEMCFVSPKALTDRLEAYFNAA
ncbi:1,4-dihydroxy-2-naphthoyl-CoA hydrolase [Grimontia celer]|uniref:1,4-dihydroxy-2-naphthoyl-CoA hydrolase n=1 Tax=Grimontia celer TaxID=1796497 RepID=A0A128FAG5_9GAMM|nr:acyl-CoA thioesterase [Grimontia celer]CZF83728.1 1,4-dihydroxy-2-naphthoyl-CoA hydrolase [Grimontia celer]